MDQAQLETVLPAPGGAVRIVNGPNKGMRAIMVAVDTAKFQAQVALKSGDQAWMEYEEICKIHSGD